MISYSLSMIPDWRQVLKAGAGRLKPGGSLHIVDFGQSGASARIARTLLKRWLALFGCHAARRFWSGAVGDGQGLERRPEFRRPFRGYAQYNAVLTLPPKRKIA